MPPLHIIWDWNGTLLDDTHACVRSINHMLTRRNLATVDEERYRELFGFPVRGYYETLGFDFAREDWDQLAREFHDHYARESRDAGLRGGIRDTLDGLRSRGIPMSVLSASEQSILDRMMAERGLAGYFATTRGLTDLYASSKLEQGRALLRDLALPPDRVLLVGDTLHDYEVATQLQCSCVLLAGGHQAAHRLRRCRCAVVEHPSAIPGD